ncbi:MAG: hypothetical protein ABID38_06970 [Candidatus Diapherotrites archaeon]
MFRPGEIKRTKEADIVIYCKRLVNAQNKGKPPYPAAETQRKEWLKSQGVNVDETARTGKIVFKEKK